MSAPAPMHYPEIPCCSPATTESVAVVRDKIADSRADLLVGQGNILRSQGDYTATILKGQGEGTSAILRDVNSSSGFINANTDRGFLASMSQTDKYGLAGLNASVGVSDNVTRSGFAGVAATHDTGDKLGLQANTVAWNQAAIQGAGFAESRNQVERVNDFQSATSDRANKFLAGSISDSFARLGAQGENGFYRTGTAVGAVDKQVVQSEVALGRATASGFTDIGNNVRDSYARLSEQNCQTKEVVAAYGNRQSDQTASVLATLSAQHAGITRDIGVLGREITLQSANQFGSLQLEASKNTAAIQIEASKNTASMQLQAALNAKESLLEQSKWFALAEKTAMINKCELEAKIAACCCEVKEAVTGTANVTQSLIQATDANRVRDALSTAATENAILKLRREEHHHPHPHHYPYPYPYPFPPVGAPGTPGRG